MKICKLFLLLSLLSFSISPCWAQMEDCCHVPVLMFQVKKVADPAIIELVKKHEEYIKGKNNFSVPAEVTNKAAKNTSLACNHLYNIRHHEQPLPFNLDNVRFIEALLAEGYCLNSYFSLPGSEGMPVKGMQCTLIGYDLIKEYFFGRLPNGKENQLSYDFVTKTIQFAELEKSPDAEYLWTFTPKYQEPIEVKAGNLHNALVVLSKQSEENEFLARVCSTENLITGESRGTIYVVNLPYCIKIFKKLVDGAGCDYYVPNGYQGQYIYWDESDGTPLGYHSNVYPTSSKYYTTARRICQPCGTIQELPQAVIMFVEVHEGYLFVFPTLSGHCCIVDNMTNSATICGVVKWNATK